MTADIEAIKRRTYRKQDDRPGYEFFSVLVERDPAKCSAAVDRWTNSSGKEFSRQCARKPGHGSGGLFCKQHAKRERLP